jgi:Bifunctional DNA primase/polymerase, N-terminal/AAA domain
VTSSGNHQGSCNSNQWEAALGYAAVLGWPVFPLRPRDKRPAISAAHEPGHGCQGECGAEGHGFYDVTTDPEQIEAWAARFPDANIGIRCDGQGPDVLDVDGTEGESSLAELGGIQPDWVESRSGRGRHFWFQAAALRRIGFKPGLEWCGQGGYVVAPGSIHPTGTVYTWTSGEPPRSLPPAPAWVERPPVPQPSSKSGVVIPAVQGPYRDWSSVETVPSGSRHSTLLGFTWWLAEQGTPHEVARIAIRQMLDKQLDGKTAKVTAAEAWGMFETARTKLAAAFRGRAENQQPLTDSNQDQLIMRASDMEERVLRWLRRPYLPLGVLAIIEGDPDLGKSTITLDLTAAITTGRQWPVRSTTDLPGAQNVLVVCGEDDWEYVILPRLRAAGANLDRVFSYTLRQDEHRQVVPMSLPEDLPRLRQAIVKASARLGIIDPISAYLSERISTGVDQSVRRALAPLAQIAQEEASTVVMVRHLNKRGDMKAMYRGGGSDTYSRRNPQIEVEVDHPAAGRQVFRGAPDAEVQMAAKQEEVT